MSYPHGPELREAIAGRLAAFDVRAQQGEDLRRAAVAAALVPNKEGQSCFLLTRRAAGLNAHKGQWALPGGRLDEGETPVEAALRELDEELGLQVGADDVLGQLDDYGTRSGYAITPVVLWCAECPRLEPSAQEVASVHKIPLAELDRPDAPRFVEHEDVDAPILQMPIGDGYIHAPTAALLLQLREVALHGRDTRVAHYEQPRFAWR